MNDIHLSQERQERKKPMEEVFVYESEKAIVRVHGKPNLKLIEEAARDFYKAILKDDAKKGKVTKERETNQW